MPRYIDANFIKTGLKQEFCAACSSDYENNRQCCAACNIAYTMNLIDETPTADVEPVRHGRWIYCEDDYGQDGIVCSLCGHFVPWYYDYYESSDDLIKDNLKCPHCGAKMDGGKDNA